MAHNFNYDKYLDYLKSTQRSWRLFMGGKFDFNFVYLLFVCDNKIEYPKTPAQYKATFKALKESTTVERLKFLYTTGKLPIIFFFN